MKNALRFLIVWNELWSLPLALILWWASPWLLRLVDPTAGTYDAGIFQIILFTVIQAMVYHAVAWILIKMTFPGVYKYIDVFLERSLFNKWENKENSLTQWQKSKFSLFVFALYLLYIALVSRIV